MTPSAWLTRVAAVLIAFGSVLGTTGTTAGTTAAAAGAGLAADPIPPVPKPATKARSLREPSYIDPVYGNPVWRATEPSDYEGAASVRHEYSRRQAFNADNSRFLAQSSNGYWLLYDATTFRVLRRAGPSGALREMAGDAEPIWHPTDPRKLWYTANYGGLIWWEKDVERDVDTVMADFRGRLPWPRATSVWTKAEGTSSADGRYFAFMATSYDDVKKQNTIHGLLTYDRQQDRILGTLDAAAFGHAWPDHISITPSGRYAVPSWAYAPKLGTRAYTLDFKQYRVLHTESEHSDLAIGPDGQDLYVATNYQRGVIWAVDCATGASFDLMPLYPRSGSAYAAHVSGQAFGRPGWAVISTYADSASYGSVAPDPVLQPMYRKVMLVELRPGGRRVAIAHTRAAAKYGGYGGEHQATISRDGSRILFATNFDDGGPASSYLVAVPESAYRR